MNRLLLTLSFCLSIVATLLAQVKVTGKVLDSSDQSVLPGASILVKNGNSGAVTNIDGMFEVTVPNTNAVLVISYTGFKQLEYALNGRTNVEISLTSDNVLQDLVVVGYGTQTKKELTGSVAKVSGESIQRLQTSGLDQAISGQAPGVQVVSNTGTPGGAVSIRVRGPSTISGSAQPLFVIDGVPINTGNYAQLGTGNQTTNALNDIAPSDIESIEILKDAAAASIYGSRASNGVVLVTTKRGKAGKTRINFNSFYGTQEAWKQVEPLTGQEYASLVNEMRRNRGGLSVLFPDSTNVANTNWQQEIFRTAPMYSADLSFAGGNERTQFALSGGYFNQEGIVRGSSYNRLNARINLDNRITDNVKLTFSSYLSQSVSTRINNDNNINGVVSAAILMGSHIPVRNPNGTYGKDPNSSVENPVAGALEPTFENPTGRILSNVGLTWDILPGLTYRPNFGVDYVNYREFRFNPTTTNTGAGTLGQGFETYARDLNVITEHILNYRKVFDAFGSATGLKFDVLGGYSYQQSEYEDLFLQGEGYPGNTVKTLNAASVKRDAQSRRSEFAIQSLFGRLNIGLWDDLLVLSGVIRRDGVSRFGEDNRFGLFPGGSLAVNLGDLQFIEDLGIFSTLKLKAGYGRRGNANIGGNIINVNYAARGLVEPGFNYNQIAGVAPTQLGNPALAWEVRDDITAGIDLGFFKNRLNVSVEYYDAKTSNLLLPRPLVGASGFTTISQNVGSMQNKGIDMSIIADVIQKKNFSWNVNFNISGFNNEITDIVSPFAQGFASWVEEGQELGSFRGFEAERIFQTQAEINALDARARELFGASAVYQTTLTRPGDIQFKDINGDGRITTDDQRILGSAQPDFFGGVTNTITAFGVDLSFFLQGQYGNLIYNNTRAFAEGMNGVFGQVASVRQRWTPSNPTTDINMPRAVWGDPNNNRRTSNRFLEDGSFMRLRNFTLGYTLPRTLIERAKISKFRVYMSAQNWLTFTNYKGLDPEVSTFAEGTANSTPNTAPGTDFLTFPQARTLSFGISVGF